MNTEQTSKNIFKYSEQGFKFSWWNSLVLSAFLQQDKKIKNKIIIKGCVTFK